MDGPHRAPAQGAADGRAEVQRVILPGKKHLAGLPAEHLAGHAPLHRRDGPLLEQTRLVQVVKEVPAKDHARDGAALDGIIEKAHAAHHTHMECRHIETHEHEKRGRGGEGFINIHTNTLSLAAFAPPALHTHMHSAIKKPHTRTRGTTNTYIFSRRRPT